MLLGLENDACSDDFFLDHELWLIVESIGWNHLFCFVLWAQRWSELVEHISDNRFISLIYFILVLQENCFVQGDDEALIALVFSPLRLRLLNGCFYLSWEAFPVFEELQEDRKWYIVFEKNSVGSDTVEQSSTFVLGWLDIMKLDF